MILMIYIYEILFRNYKLLSVFHFDISGNEINESQLENILAIFLIFVIPLNLISNFFSFLFIFLILKLGVKLYSLSLYIIFNFLLSL